MTIASLSSEHGMSRVIIEAGPRMSDHGEAVLVRYTARCDVEACTTLTFAAHDGVEVVAQVALAWLDDTHAWLRLHGWMADEPGALAGVVRQAVSH